MGNICSKSSNPSDPFAQPGRVLGPNNSAPIPASRTPAPRSTESPSPFTKGGKALGSNAIAGEAAPGGGANPRSAAAQAAEKRAKNLTATSSKGKLSSQLAAQKAKTRNETLDEVSRDERAARDVDTADAVRRWD